MRKRILILSLLVLFNSITSFGQVDSNMFTRLYGLKDPMHNGMDYYNIDGIEITSQIIYFDYSKRNIWKSYNKFPKERDLNTSDNLLNYPNYYIGKTNEIISGAIEYKSYYFIENAEKKITALTFSSINKIDRTFERKFISLIYRNEIPPSILSPLEIDSINFANRKIALGNNCSWMAVNNVQCSNGQMNWSVHKTLDDASLSVTNQYNVIKAKNGGKIISEDSVDVIFEGSEVKAKKVIYDFTGVTSVLVKISGGKTLTIYFVASPVRQNFVSCVMSFWNNANINPSGLTPLLEEVMKLKK